MKIQQLYKYISQGEHVEQDFKHCINDSRKIAISLAAFANTQGGRLLIGVKDNGKIAGVNCNEEFHMIEAAAVLYCKPKINFESVVHTIDGKEVLEISIPKSQVRPHFAKDKEGKWIAYQRVKDENKRINKLLLDIWKTENKKIGEQFNFSDIDKQILRTIEDIEGCTPQILKRKLKIKHFQLHKKLVLFGSFGLISVDWKQDRLVLNANEIEIERI